MSDTIDLKQFLSGFLSETNELLRTANTNLLALESASGRGGPNPRAVRELYRALHTIKGLAGMVGVHPIVDLAHALETVLRAADRGAGQLSSEAVELCLKGVRAIEERVHAVAKHKEAPPAPVQLLEALGRIEPTAAVAPRAGPLPLPPPLLAKLAPAELQQLTQGIAEGRRLFHLEFLPSPARAAFVMECARRNYGRPAVSPAASRNPASRTPEVSDWAAALDDLDPTKIFEE